MLFRLKIIAYLAVLAINTGLGANLEVLRQILMTDLLSTLAGFLSKRTVPEMLQGVFIGLAGSMKVSICVGIRTLKLLL